MSFGFVLELCKQPEHVTAPCKENMYVAFHHSSIDTATQGHELYAVQEHVRLTATYHASEFARVVSALRTPQARPRTALRYTDSESQIQHTDISHRSVNVQTPCQFPKIE